MTFWTETKLRNRWHFPGIAAQHSISDSYDIRLILETLFSENVRWDRISVNFISLLKHFEVSKIKVVTLWFTCTTFSCVPCVQIIKCFKHLWCLLYNHTVVKQTNQLTRTYILLRDDKNLLILIFHLKWVCVAVFCYFNLSRSLSRVHLLTNIFCLKSSPMHQFDV